MKTEKTNDNGVALNYRRAGEGDDVVLIHGLATNHAFWRLDVLLTLAKEYRVTVYDLRGHGHTEAPKSDYSSFAMVEDLDHLLNHLSIAKAHLIGHSLGGVIALHYAALHPERVYSLTIADSRVRSLQPTNYVTDWPNWEKIKKKFDEIGLYVPEDEAEAGLWLLEKIASPEWQMARHKLNGFSLFVPFGGWNGGQRTAERWLDLLNNTTAREDLRRYAGPTIEMLKSINLPAFVIFGENSTAMKSFKGLQECLPDCKTHIIPGAGHFFPLTRPKIFVNLVIPFIKESEEIKGDIG